MAYPNRNDNHGKNNDQQPVRRLLSKDEKDAVVDVIDQLGKCTESGVSFEELMSDPEAAQNIKDLRSEDYKGYARSIAWLGALTEGEKYLSVLAEVFYPGQIGAVGAIATAFAEIAWLPVNYNTDQAKVKLLELGSERLTRLAKEVAGGVTARTLRERVMLDGSLQRMVNEALDEARKREASNARNIAGLGGTNGVSPAKSGGLLARFKAGTTQTTTVAKPAGGLLARFKGVNTPAAKLAAQGSGLLARFKTGGVQQSVVQNDAFLTVFDEVEAQFPDHVGAVRYARGAYEKGETTEVEARAFLEDILQVQLA